MPVFAIPGNGRYAVQPVHIDDLVRICLEAASVGENLITDAAGPETMSFERLVRAIGSAVGAHARIVHLPPLAMAAIARALGLLVRDVVLTPGEIEGLMAGLLVSHRPALGRIAFTNWLKEKTTSLGRSYANELERHYTQPPAR